MCSLLKRRDIKKMKVYAPLPQADAPCLRGEEPSGLAAHRQTGKGKPGWVI